MNNNDKLAKVNYFITTSFRDTADQDYISARIMFKYKMPLQFFWLSLQAIEKYFKAILLFNNQSAIIKPNGHDIIKCLNNINNNISDINLNLSKDIINFLNILNDYGSNRYFEFSYSISGNELPLLDKSVWNIRKYCFDIRKNNWIDDKNNPLDELYLKMINDEKFNKHPNKYSLFTGFLEKTLNNKKSIIRKELIWKNLYYGKYKKHKICYRAGQSANSPLFMFEEVYELLKGKVKFSDNTKEYFKKKAQKGT